MIKNNLNVVKYYNRFTFVFELGMPHGVNTMTRFVVVVGTADTKLDELVWLKYCLHLAGVDSIIIDVSTSIPGKNYQNNRIDIHSLQVAEYHPAAVTTCALPGTGY
ncbi:Tm-1-like ATP-binding domain-containing protein [Photorhabdus heterorhabditis]|uniref:Tm-1-like ATP-binding domain-containing protein n=1 Tax=Photorhabdus heterorhabditis TaxID=880156 RepID=UPI0030B7FAC3